MAEPAQEPHAAARRMLIERAEQEIADGLRAKEDRERPRGTVPVKSASIGGDYETAWAQSARTVVQRAGHNRGAARDALIDVLASCDCAVSVAEIEAALSDRHVARASVYRALELLQSLHLVARIDIGDGVARFERAHRDHGDHHHHLVCGECGKLIAFDDAELEDAINKIGRRMGFETSEHEVTLRGSCSSCR